MDDDLNTSAALGELFELARPLRSLANRLRVGETAGPAEVALAPRWRLLVELAGVLGLVQEAPADAASGAGSQPEVATIEALIEERRQAKANRDFNRADAIRAQLQEKGIELVDKPGGVTIWLPKA